MLSGKFKKPKTRGFRLKLPEYFLDTVSAHADNFILTPLLNHFYDCFKQNRVRVRVNKNCRQGVLIYRSLPAGVSRDISASLFGAQTQSHLHLKVMFFRHQSCNV